MPAMRIRPFIAPHNGQTHRPRQELLGISHAGPLSLACGRLRGRDGEEEAARSCRSRTRPPIHALAPARNSESCNDAPPSAPGRLPLTVNVNLMVWSHACLRQSSQSGRVMRVILAVLSVAAIVAAATPS